METARLGWLRFLLHYLLVELMVFGGVALVSLAIGWRTVPEYCTGLFIAGALMLVFASLRRRVVNGNLNLWVMSAPLSGETLSDRLYRHARESAALFSSDLRWYLYALTPIVASFVILAIVGW